MRTCVTRAHVFSRPIIVQQESFHLLHIKVPQVFGASEEVCCLPAGANHDPEFVQTHLTVAVVVKEREESAQLLDVGPVHPLRLNLGGI
jgi:hypothetical protein